MSCPAFPPFPAGTAITHVPWLWSPQCCLLLSFASTSVTRALQIPVCGFLSDFITHEYIVASKDMELEKARKAIKVEQCLRVKLKTFSALRE